MRARVPAIVLLLLAACPEPPAVSGGGPQAPEPAEVPVLREGVEVGSLYQPGEVRAFTFRQAGQVIGRSWGRYEGAETVEGRRVHRFSGRIEQVVPLEASDVVPEGELRGTSELVVDDSGTLISGWERSGAAELRIQVVGDEVRAEAITGVPRKETWSFSLPQAAGTMGYMATTVEELMLGVRDLRAGEQGWPMISLSTARRDDWTGTIERDSKGLTIRTGLGETIDFRDGRIVRLEVPDAELVVEPSEGEFAQWPQWELDAPLELRYSPPADGSLELRRVELPGRANDPTLIGEIVLPTERKRPAPGVLFLGGSAPADRHGFAGPPAVDLGSWEITDALAQAGFVVMRYDDRSTGESQLAELTWLGQVEDARRALRTLLVQDEVDPDRVVVVGHGEGGWRALYLADEYEKSVNGVALLATPGRGYKELFAEQPGLLEALEKGTTLPAILEVSRLWYEEVLGVDPVRLLAASSTPLFVAHGGKDFEVDSALAARRLTKAAKKSKRAIVQRAYPGLDHLFKPEPGESSQRGYLVTRSVDRGFIADLVEWARSRAAGAG
jgi:pimeloyl-ACP methyl ester carboxylesterase